MQSFKDHFLVHPHNANTPLELRCLSKSKGAKSYMFYPDDYSTQEVQKMAFYKMALEKNIEGFNCYSPINQIKSDFRALPGKGTSQNEIAWRCKLMIDCDRATKVGKAQPATDDELKRAEIFADSVSAYLEIEDWVKPYKVMSGNGYHLYIPIDYLINNHESDLLVKDVLEKLAHQLNTAEFEIDTMVFDAARITKVIGTKAIKGDETSDRPHRTVELIK
jgi:hypothetical protein